MAHVKLNTEYGEIEIWEASWGSELNLAHSENANAKVTLSSLEREDDADTLAGGCTVDLASQYGGLTADEARLSADVLKFAAELADLIEYGYADLIKDAKKRQQKEEAEAEKARAARAERLEERKDQLMNELVGEMVRIRHYGYKTAVRAILAVTEGYGGEYRVRFEYVVDQDWARPQTLDRIQRLDAKIDGKWQTIWDDGKDDLPYYDRGSADQLPDLPKYDGMNKEER